MKINRRDLLKWGVSLGVAGALSRFEGASLWGETKPTSSPLLTRVIPATQEKIPALGLGTWKTFDVKPDQAKWNDVKTVLRLFHEKGGTVVDTAHIYGEAEEALGRLSTELALKKELFWATKVMAWSGFGGEGQIETSFEALQIKSIDLFQIHNLLDLQDQLKNLRRLKEEGRIRYIGVTHWRDAAHDDLARVIQKEKPDFVQFNLNVANRNAEKRLLPLAEDLGIATLINRPFEGGYLFERVKGKALPPWAEEWGITAWSQFFLKYLLSFPGVTCPIPATANPAHLAENMKAGHGPLPDQKTRKKMAALFS